MNKRAWEVEWRACPQFDGMDRLGQAVRLVIDHAVAPSVPQWSRRGTPSQSSKHDADMAAREGNLREESTSSVVCAGLDGTPEAGENRGFPDRRDGVGRERDGPDGAVRASVCR